MAKGRKYTPNPNRIAAKLTKLLKDKIKELALIDTGQMLDTIYAEPDGRGGFTIHAEPYFKFLDEGTQYIPAFNIITDVINSKEFQDYIETVLIDEVIYDIEDFA